MFTVSWLHRLDERNQTRAERDNDRFAAEAADDDAGAAEIVGSHLSLWPGWVGVAAALRSIGARECRFSVIAHNRATPVVYGYLLRLCGGDRDEAWGLGHRSLRMTLTYARIANKTVADEYATASAKIDALYTATDPEQRLQQLAGEHRRMLANGWCNRPIATDCAYETICEGCGYYQTTVEFRPTLRAQADHAERNHQTERAVIYNRLLDTLPRRDRVILDHRNNPITLDRSPKITVHLVVQPGVRDLLERNR